MHCSHMCVPVCAMVNMWLGEENFCGYVLSFHHGGLGAQTLVVRFCGKYCSH